MSTLVKPSPFAGELRRWRTLRRLSQLELANRAGTTQRHLVTLSELYLEAFLPADEATAEILRARAG